MRFLILIPLFCFSSLNAQVLNIEAPTVSIDSLKKNDLKWGLGLNGNISKQSLFVYDASLLSEATYHRNDRHQLLINAQYFRTGSNLGDLINGGFIFFRLTPEFHHRIAPQWVLQYQSDLGRGMKERMLTALNVKAEVFKNEKFAFSLLQAPCSRKKHGTCQEQQTQPKARVCVNCSSLTMYYAFISKLDHTLNSV